jgi:hypothetical protein
MFRERGNPGGWGDPISGGSGVLSFGLTALAIIGFGSLGCEEQKKTYDTVCAPSSLPSKDVARPEFLMSLSIGNTGWFSPPMVYDLDGDGQREIIGAFYNVGVWSAQGDLLYELERGDYHTGRVYAPAAVGDLEGDGVSEVVVAAGDGSVAAYEWREGELRIKSGWPASTCYQGECSENRSLACADLDGDGMVEVVVANTNTENEGHVWVFGSDGSVYQPAGLSYDAWPRYNTDTGVGGDADANCYGHNGFGCYGLNLAVGNTDDDPELEIVATYDNHHIQVFDPDGMALLADQDYFTRRGGDCEGSPMSWGQFIRYIDPEVEEAHYHLHEGDWPGPGWTLWAQFTHSPPAVADVDGDGRNEVVGIANAEQDEPYHTYHHAFFVFRGNHVYDGDLPDPSGDGYGARRLSGWVSPPLTEHPLPNDDWYPPSNPPSVTAVDIRSDDGDPRPELLAAINDGYIYAFGPEADLLWRYDYTRGKPLMYASEVTVADLSGDGRPEVIAGVYGEDVGDGRLLILSAAGDKLHDIELPGQRENGNGIGAAAAPTVADIDGDGTLEILVLTIDHGIDVFTVPGSAENCLLWPTGRANYLRNAMGPATKE